MLGVRNLFLMYDNEASGRGNQAMDIESRVLAKHFNVHVLPCPASDPSAALQSATLAAKLKRLLNSIEAPAVDENGLLDMDGL